MVSVFQVLLGGISDLPGAANLDGIGIFCVWTSMYSQVPNASVFRRFSVHKTWLGTIGTALESVATFL